LFFLQVETIRAVLKKELDLPIVEIGDESAKLDGGDVLFTGNAVTCSMQKLEDVTLLVIGL
jgi:dimethylargininase